MIEVEKEENSDEKPKLNEPLNANTKLKKTLTFNEIMATAVLFLSAGYETTANTLCFIAYNLALNSNVQEKACNEIDKILENHVF